MGKNCDIIWHDILDSTNSEAERRLSGIDNMSVIAAVTQTAGRGQRGNRWESAPGENLTFTIVMKFGLPYGRRLAADGQFLTSEVTAIAVTGFLRSHHIEAKIKWPNDIYVGDRKICGILIRHCIHGNEVAATIAGIGLNVNQTVFSPGIPNPVSMAMLTGQRYDIRESLKAFVTVFSHVLDDAFTDGGMERTEKMYLDLLYRKDEVHRYIDCRTGKEFTGIIRGVSRNACLRVEMPDGSTGEYAFKEIAYIIDDERL